MTQQERLAVLAEVHCADKVSVWEWAPDGRIPPEARLYMVYDGPSMVGGGLWPSTHAKVLCARCKEPIVLWSAGAKRGAAAPLEVQDA